MESRQEVLREAEGSAVGSYIRSREGGGGIWHRRGALEFRRFDEVRRDLGLELRRGDVLAAAAPRGEHVGDRVQNSWKEEVGIRTDTFMEPQIHCYWDSAWGPPGTQSARARQKPPSKFLLEFSWNTAHDSNEMNLTDTAMTLEHYVDWK